MKLFTLSLLFSLSACTSSTKYGRCVGLNQAENPIYKYEYNGWNIGLAIVFAELVAPPIIVVLNESKCPVGKK